MMKGIFVIAIISFFFSCATQSEIIEYKYTQATQMGKTTIAVTKDSIVKSFAGRGAPSRTAFVTSPKNWADLNAAMEKVELKNLGNLTAPTNKRQTDIAPYGRLYFTTKDSTYRSLDFDGTDAHADLEGVMVVFEELLKLR